MLCGCGSVGVGWPRTGGFVFLGCGYMLQSCDGASNWGGCGTGGGWFGGRGGGVLFVTGCGSGNDLR